MVSVTSRLLFAPLSGLIVPWQQPQGINHLRPGRRSPFFADWNHGDQSAAGLQDAVYLPKGFPVIHMFQHVGAENGIQAGICQRNVFSVFLWSTPGL